MLILLKGNICRRHGEIDTNMCHCFLVPLQDCVWESFTTLCSKISLVPMHSWDVICNVCSFSSCLLHIKPVYTRSMSRNQGLGGQSSSSCWAHRSDRTPKPAAQALLLAPAVKLHLSRVCDLIQINLAINLGKTERLISRMGALDLLRKGH